MNGEPEVDATHFSLNEQVFVVSLSHETFNL